MKSLSFPILVGTTGVLLLACVFLYDRIAANRELSVVTVQTQNQTDGEMVKFVYNAHVRNNHSVPIRLCGGQMNWCGQSGCYNMETPFPIVLESGQEITIAISISPREDKLSETELTLYADGEGLAGLTPIKIKLPAMSLQSP